MTWSANGFHCMSLKALEKVMSKNSKPGKTYELTKDGRFIGYLKKT